MALRVDHLATGLDGVANNIADIDGLTTKRNPTRRQSRHVQQVVHQPDEMFDLPFHRLPHLARDSDLVAGPGLHGKGVTDRREWIAEPCASIARNSSLRRSASRSASSARFLSSTSTTDPHSA